MELHHEGDGLCCHGDPAQAVPSSTRAQSCSIWAGWAERGEGNKASSATPGKVMNQVWSSSRVPVRSNRRARRASRRDSE